MTRKTPWLLFVAMLLSLSAWTAGAQTTTTQQTTTTTNPAAAPSSSPTDSVFRSLSTPAPGAGTALVPSAAASAPAATTQTVTTPQVTTTTAPVVRTDVFGANLFTGTFAGLGA
ncbi:MAG: hypothetical protein K0R89_3510, partial [Ramlibacter sp.]|nr:hypothetical protein [Ramlibacter sp.]